MDKEKFLSSGLIELYVIGLASERDAKVVRQYCDSFPDIQQKVDAMNEAMREYAIAHSVVPPESLKEKTFSELDQIISNKDISSEITAGSSTKTSAGLSKPGIVIALLLFALMGYGLLHFSGKYNSEKLKTNLLNQQLTECREDNQNIESSNQIFALQNQFLKDNKTAHVHLRGTPNAPNALAVAYWNEEEDFAYLNILDLPKPNSDKQYQLWADVEGEMISLGVLDYEKEKLIRIPHIAHAESLNITLEEFGGAESPNVSQIFMSGKV